MCVFVSVYVHIYHSFIFYIEIITYCIDVGIELDIASESHQ